MRDPKRIEVITTKLMYCWSEVPDWRFGQLIENLKRYSGRHDLFYMEDHEFEKLLDEFFDEDEERYI